MLIQLHEIKENKIFRMPKNWGWSSLTLGPLYLLCYMCDTGEAIKHQCLNPIYASFIGVLLKMKKK